MMKIRSVKRALLSVSNKTGIADFANALVSLGIEIISTGGTSQALCAANVPHRLVDELTGWPDMLGGRVKTLHPKVHGGILGLRDKQAEEAQAHQIEWIDLVVVNFYPFLEVIKKPSLTVEEAIESIDIGGPTMVRAAAKNAAWVTIATEVCDYELILSALRDQGGIPHLLREQLARKAFALTRDYDAAICDYFSRESQSSEQLITPAALPKLQDRVSLRYGENPHQQACAYSLGERGVEKTGILSAHQYQGKPLSYNNYLDADAAWACLNEFTRPTCVIIKHANPCGVATAIDIEAAWESAFRADSLSAFGGIVALNRPCTEALARAIAGIFIEVVLAPAYTEEALAIFAVKPNLRVLALPFSPAQSDGGVLWEMRFITGAVLMQEKDRQPLRAEQLKVVTDMTPSAENIEDLLFAWRVTKHSKSNAIVIAKQHCTRGIGAGLVSRIDAVDLAVRKAGNHTHGAVLASDAFFPFRDSIDRLAETGIRAIIQPGGSLRDEEVIAACNQYGIAMVFTGMRCFRH